MDKIKIIVVEDNIVYCEFVCNLLAREGFRTVQAFHLSTARKLLQQAADGDIVVSDLRLPDGNGIDLLRWMRKEGMTQPFIIMTDYAEVHTAVESMKLGSLDYIPKQLVEDKLVPLLRTILKERNIGRSRMPVFARDGSAFRKIMHRIRLVAPTDMSVLIFGENGTGKEHIAHHLHDKSKRSGKPFVAVDCGSLNKELAPSAFFGHVKGAFTGADSAKKGYFHEAEGGTLFLDEVGNLAPETQQMLLRAIQERRYRPVGDRTDRSFNVRIIAATNENLEKAVNEKRFRQDLLYRLHDFDITVPPLRDCQEDIMPLAEFFREIANNELECKVSGFSSEARKALLTHSWPGNVRELRQKIMGAVLQAQTGLVTKEHLELGITETTSITGFSLRNDEEDKERILRALKQADGNRKVAAELLGIGRTTLKFLFTCKKLLMTKKKLPVRFTGQHFTIDKVLIKDAIRQANISNQDTVLDIGAGKGFLTVHLLKIANNVVAIENDTALVEHLRKLFSDARNVQVVGCDFRNFAVPKFPFKVVSNIPYGITSDIFKILMFESLGNFLGGSIVLQLEPTQKLFSRKLYNPYTVFYHTFFDLKLVYEVGPESFLPPPTVKSALLNIKRKHLFFDFKFKAKYLAFISCLLEKPDLSVKTALKSIFRKSQVRSISEKFGLNLNAQIVCLSPSQWLNCFLEMLEVVPEKFHPS